MTNSDELSYLRRQVTTLSRENETLREDNARLEALRQDVVLGTAGRVVMERDALASLFDKDLLTLPLQTKVATTTLSTRGQLVIPESLREEFDLEPGASFICRGVAGRIVLEPVR